MGQQCPDRSSESLKKGALRMSELKDTHCVLTGPGHNLPLDLELGTFDATTFMDSIRYEGEGVFRIGDNCSCHSGCNRPPKDPQDFLGDLDFVPFSVREGATGEVLYPYKNTRLGCEALFTVHNPDRLHALISEPNDSILEIALGFKHSRLLSFPETGEYFWLKGNDGSITGDTALFEESSGHMNGCTGILFHTFKVNGPSISECINAVGGVFRATQKNQ